MTQTRSQERNKDTPRNSDGAKRKLKRGNAPCLEKLKGGKVSYNSES